MKTIKQLLKKVRKELILSLSKFLFRTTGIINKTLQNHWTEHGKKMQEELNKEHETQIKYRNIE